MIKKLFYLIAFVQLLAISMAQGLGDVAGFFVSPEALHAGVILPLTQLMKDLPIMKTLKAQFGANAIRGLSVVIGVVASVTYALVTKDPLILALFLGVQAGLVNTGFVALVKELIPNNSESQSMQASAVTAMQISSVRSNDRDIWDTTIGSLVYSSASKLLGPLSPLLTLALPSLKGLVADIVTINKVEKIHEIESYVHREVVGRLAAMGMINTQKPKVREGAVMQTALLVGVLALALSSCAPVLQAAKDAGKAAINVVGEISADGASYSFGDNGGVFAAEDKARQNIIVELIDLEGENNIAIDQDIAEFCAVALVSFEGWVCELELLGAQDEWALYYAFTDPNPDALGMTVGVRFQNLDGSIHSALPQ